MSLPNILALDVVYDIDEENLRKTLDMKLDINKDKLDELNLNLEEMQKMREIIQSGIVEYKDNNFEFLFNFDEMTDDDKEFAKKIHPILDLNINCFDSKRTFYLYRFEYNENTLDAVKDFYKKDFKDRLDMFLEDLVEKVEEKTNKYHNLYYSLVDKTGKHVESLWENINLDDDNYVYYLPNKYMWEYPLDLNRNKIDINSINYVIRTLNVNEEETFNQKSDKINIKLFEFDTLCNEPSVKSFTDVVDYCELPLLYKDNKSEIRVTNASREKPYFAKLYFGLPKNNTNLTSLT